MDTEEYQEALDEAQDAQEDSQELTEANLDSLDAMTPQAKQDNSLYSLFWKVVKAKDSTKVGRLNNVEMGQAWMNVRGSKQMAILSEVFHHPGLMAFFMASAENVVATSMARDGWLGELFVSQKKFQTKAKNKGGQSPNDKWRLFQKKQGIPAAE